MANSGKALPRLFGWKSTINSLLQIWRFLQTEKHYQFLLTSCFNQHYQFLLTSCFNQHRVKNLFSVIRGSGGHRDNPDVSEFCVSFMTIAVNKLFVPVSGANCEIDCDNILLDMAAAVFRYSLWH